MIELAIRNGLVVDGTGAEPQPADVGIDEGRIVAVGAAPEAERENSITTSRGLVDGVGATHSCS